MKIQCDVCGIEEASLLCCADEAALCRGCDGRVHSANKLAGKHRRLSLLHPSSPWALPLCDICKEKRGFVFCQQDRAIFCRDCDLPIHSANDHTAKHSRFLLTGIMLSALPMPSPLSSPPSQTEIASSSITAISRNGFPATEELGGACSSSSSTPTAGAKDRNGAGSSISEYLMKMLPGWRVDDFLSCDAGYLLAEEALWAAEDGAGAKMEDATICVQPFSAPVAETARDRLHPLLDSMEGSGSEWREEELSMVPELEHHSAGKKRSRIASLWC